MVEDGSGRSHEFAPMAAGIAGSSNVEKVSNDCHELCTVVYYTTETKCHCKDPPIYL